MPGTYLLISPPGSGKTTLACIIVPALQECTKVQMPDMYPALLLDVDCKADRMLNIKPLVDAGKIVIHPVRIPMIAQSFRERALNPDKGLKFQPEGFLYTVDRLNEVIDRKEDYLQYKTIILDSTTRMCEHLKRLLIFLRGQGKLGSDSKGKAKVKGDMNWPAWGSFLADLEEVFIGLVQTPNINIVVTAHLKKETEHDDLTGTTIITDYLPLIDGQMRDKLAGYFNEVYYLDKLDSLREHKTKYRFRTTGAKYQASSSMNLPEIVEVDAPKIIQQVLARKEGDVLSNNENTSSPK